MTERKLDHELTTEEANETVEIEVTIKFTAEVRRGDYTDYIGPLPSKSDKEIAEADLGELAKTMIKFDVEDEIFPAMSNRDFEPDSVIYEVKE